MRWGRLRRLGPWWGVAVTAAVGVAVAAAGGIRVGGYLLSASLAGAALLRAVVPGEAVGGIAVRRRWLDVAAMTLLALTVFTAFALVRV